MRYLKNSSRGMIKITLVVITYFLLKIHFTFGQIPCQPKGYTSSINETLDIRDSKDIELSCLRTSGFDMCTDICTRSTNCTYVKYSNEYLSCTLMKAKNIEFQAAKVGGPSNQNECGEGSSTTHLKQRGSYCVEHIDLIDECCTQRYLVTGKYGVPKDRVTFSSVRNLNPSDDTYQIDSKHGWIPSSFQNQWIQVLFYQRKLVNCVITRGLPMEGHRDWVSKYRLKVLSMNSKWIEVLDESGNQKDFPGNVDGFSDKINCLPNGIRTAGVQIIPIEWASAIVLRFDIIGC